MYFERWGLLAPPPGKASLPKILLAQLFLYEYYAPSDQEVTNSGVRCAGVLACKKLSLFPTRNFYANCIYLIGVTYFINLIKAYNKEISLTNKRIPFLENTHSKHF